MKHPPSSARKTITPAQRGQIIQRVIVDGWSSAQAADDFGVSRRVVEAWVAEFRRSGMASLRDDPGLTLASEVVRLAISRPVWTMWRKFSVGLRKFSLGEPLAEPVPLRRSHKDGPQ